MIVEPS